MIENVARLIWSGIIARPHESVPFVLIVMNPLFETIPAPVLNAPYLKMAELLTSGRYWLASLAVVVPDWPGLLVVFWFDDSITMRPHFWTFSINPPTFTLSVVIFATVSLMSCSVQYSSGASGLRSVILLLVMTVAP